MKLYDLLDFENIVIQCHDNPDADALASAYGLYTFFKEHEKQVEIIYGGRNKIRKSNLVLMVEELHIPVRYAESLEKPQLLITVDCQYGEGNVTHFDAYEVAVIDHHEVSGTLPVLSEVRSNLGACSTLVWQMLKDAGFDINYNRELATAMYYGLFTDTNSLTEIAHPLDMDLRDSAKFDVAMITKFRNCNLSIEELETAGAALLRSDYIDEYRFAIVKAGICDPNILGIISDLVLEVDVIDVCLVFSVLPKGIKISVRSCVKEVNASELAAQICEGIGGGGGHFVKAGGTIKMELLIPAYEEYCRQQKFTPRMEMNEDGKMRPTVSAIKAFLEKRAMDYFQGHQIIYAKDFDMNAEELKEYIRKPIPMGYVMATDLFPVDTMVTIRTMRGDREVRIEEDMVFTIGIKGDVFVRGKEKIMKEYRLYEWQFKLANLEYEPTIKRKNDDKLITLSEYAKVCVFHGEKRVNAKRLEQKVKIFTLEDEDNYILGKAGDYLVVKNNEKRGMHTMDEKFFEQCYHLAEEENPLKAVIFDMDGTLLDTLADITDSVNEALKVHGLPMRTSDEIRRFVGNGARQLIARAIPDGEENPLFETTLAIYKTYYDYHCKDNTKPYEGISQLLKELKRRNFKIGVVSNKPDHMVKALSQEYFGEFIDVAIGEKEGVNRKPAPDTLLAAMQELGVEQDECVFIGDSDVDIATAGNAETRFIAVTWGFRDSTYLKEHGATELIALPMELLYLI